MNPQDTNSLNQFYTDLRQQILAAIEAADDGGTQDGEFTGIVLEQLAVLSGETENARVCADIKGDKLGRTLHKIDGYALSENAEHLDLFISIYRDYDQPERLTQPEVTTAFNQVKRFLNNAVKGYWHEMDESEPAYDFARELHKNGQNLVRARLFLLTNQQCNTAPPENESLRTTTLDVLLTHTIVDIRALERLNLRGEPDPITIDFAARFGKPLPCLSVPVENETYQSYLAIIPGDFLSDIYEEYGSRLLELNVRSFLQFTVGVNRGIRTTILNEPAMFLAYNNGIAATAESVELTDSGQHIKALVGLQIVNGGQTTASIFYARRKDKADVSQIFVQMKLSVVKSHEHFGEIVNNISRFANSQNKVSDSDLSANSPFHIEVEKLSRSIWTPQQPGQSGQTHWFFERARAQYKNALAREFTPARKKAFEVLNPKKQLFVKEELAKFVNVWNRLPWHVVRGNQKNYVEFMKALKAKEMQPGNVFFEDSIAKAILFRSAENLYGRRPNAIGDLRYLTVPYALAWLSKATNDTLDLYKIWKRQCISDGLSRLLYNLMVGVERFIKTNAPGSLYGEWAKREDCWKAVAGQQSFPGVDLSLLINDRTDPAKQPLRKTLTDEDTAQELLREQDNWLRSVSAATWQTVSEWGKTDDRLTYHQRTMALAVGDKVKKPNSQFTDSERQAGQFLLELIMKKAPDILRQTDEPEPVAAGEPDTELIVSVELVQQAVAFDKRRRILAVKSHLQLKDIAEGRKTLNTYTLPFAKEKINFLLTRGFEFKQ